MARKCRNIREVFLFWFVVRKHGLEEHLQFVSLARSTIPESIVTLKEPADSIKSFVDVLLH
ncbi:hypothetical protein NC652_032460 [Populus alba x Populus x berolinensis]|nr:hypothetical protein NC652_032460 [Populus alba x Populus x berolinensis]